ncbi:MAG TPA: amylo-alpha-1,6-glucosidase [Ktedonobacteraceae bacterium]|nr:amylo-alpha-1,6-glucosidase [Ktedonobacteraceae bacterium]
MIIEQDAATTNRAPTNAWNLYVGPEICQNLREGLDHEWLVTNGLGGYGAGAINGATTRSYHGLLVAALQPPVDRTVLVTKIDEEVTLLDGQTLKLGVNEYKDGTIDPQGNQYLERVGLEGDIPYFIYRLSETLTLEKRIWMEYGQNTTYVQYVLQGSLDEESEKNTQHVMLSLLPFCLSRDYHATTQGSQDWHFLVNHEGNRYCLRAYEGAPPVYLIAGPTTTFTPTGYWYWHVFHVRDSERGLPDTEDVYQPGIFRIPIAPGQRATLVLSAGNDLVTEFGGPQHEELVAQALTRHSLRVKQLLTAAAPSISKLYLQDPVQARLVVAADEFIVARPDYANGGEGKQELRLSPDRKTIIAGYPWFTDWGRDSMISLTGLMLSTGRYSEARGLLKAFASFTHDGLIPNRFPDSGAAPEYNTVDATLWMFHAISSYLSATGDWTLLKELFPVLSNIIQWHVRGTDYGIGVDSVDGLLRAGAPGVQLTWMDAKVNERVITPRRGKPVEVNALWYCALTYMESWAVHLSTDASQYSLLRSQVSQNFASRFWYEQGGYLYDVVDVDGNAGQNDASLRPNQLFAASLTHNLLSEEQTRSMFQKVTEYLLTPMGLRSLSPNNPEYHHHFNGNQVQRDSAYHQGAVWPWLIGPYIDVHLYLNSDCSALLPLLEPLIDHLWVSCLGTISEVAEPEPPYTPGGCFAQAWSVAELLRCWLLAAG